ncbi:hypothetical protein [Paractinoplanes rishiriensis]|uniref:Terminase small subunit n=1 Tax=Paractinoplanes rishiriensis TaxID=1050105 RepID=A0A919K125_9ACTN|nr:hypothetical protein [Actinoplanes rishiriensis]GIE98941.1 hypothetical protein Ari01nite_64060 [Actinoplanes rishiriensis]
MARGPVPNRSEDLARPRERKGKDIVTVTKGVARPSWIPDPDPGWHPIARQLWDALAVSGQSDFYQQSDWALAFSLCDDLSHYKNSPKRSGQMLQTIYAAMERLLVAEGDRRRVRIELDEPQDTGESAAVLAIADYRKELGLDA